MSPPTLQINAREMKNPPLFSISNPLGEQANQNPVAIPRKIQCKGGIKLGLITTDDMVGCILAVLPLYCPLFCPFMTLLQGLARWAQGALGIGKRLEVFLAWCTCSTWDVGRDGFRNFVRKGSQGEPL